MTIRCHYDGRVIVPDEAVELPVDQPLIMNVSRPGVVFVHPQEQGAGTAADLLASDPIWQDRRDMDDSLESARELRRRSERRGGDEP
jgi:hypothetical protein